MGRERNADVARQVANVVGAIFHIVAGMLLARGEMPGEDITLIQPSNYAFVVWAPIFLLCLAYAAYQALPTNRESPLLRRVGWFTATAFFFTGMWSVFVPLRQLLFAQAMLLGVFACLLVAYVRLARSERGVLSRADRWLVALPLGPFLGWATAANAVSLTSEAVRLGLVGSGGAGEALVGTVLLLLGGALAAALVLLRRTGPAQGYLAYGVTVLWALGGIVVNQYDASPVTTAAAAAATVPVALALFGALRRGRSRRGGGSAVRPGVT